MSKLRAANSTSRHWVALIPFGLDDVQTQLPRAFKAQREGAFRVPLIMRPCLWRAIVECDGVPNGLRVFGIAITAISWFDEPHCTAR